MPNIYYREIFLKLIERNARRYQRLFLNSLLVVFGGIFFQYVFIGTYSRFALDDYLTNNLYHSHGFWGFQAFWYHEWTGRFVHTFFLSVTEYFGYKLVPVLVPSVLLLWALSTFWAIRGVLKAIIRTRINAYTAILTFVLIDFTLFLAKDILRYSVYWRPSLLTYNLALIFFSLLAGVLIRRACSSSPLQLWSILLCVVAAFLAGGIVEAFTAMLGGALLSCTVFSFFISRGRVRKIRFSLLFASLGVFLSGLIMLSASGNAIRGLSIKNTHYNVFTSFVESTYSAVRYFSTIAHTQYFIFVFIICCVIGYTALKIDLTPKKALQIIGGTLSIGFIMADVYFSVMTYFLQTVYQHPLRSFLISDFFTSAMTLIIGLACGAWFRAYIKQRQFAHHNYYHLFLWFFACWAYLTLAPYDGGRESFSTRVNAIAAVPLFFFMCSFLVITLRVIPHTMFRSRQWKYVIVCCGGLLITSSWITEMVRTELTVKSLTAEAKRSAFLWDSRDQKIKELVHAGERNVATIGIPPDEVYMVMNNFTTKNIATFYHMDTIQPLPAPSNTSDIIAVPTQKPLIDK